MSKKYAKYVFELPESNVMGPSVDGKLANLQWNDPSITGEPILTQVALVYENNSGFCYGDKLCINRFDPGEKIWTTDNPHHHNGWEIFLFLGTNPQDAHDLGGEVEVWLGEGEEAEKYIITRTSQVFIPQGLTHCPLVFRKVERPFFFIAVMFSSPPGSRDLGTVPPAFVKGF